MFSSSAIGEVFKCVDVRGKLAYSDTPCNGIGAKIRVTPNDFGGPPQKPENIEPSPALRGPSARGEASALQEQLFPTPEARSGVNMNKGRSAHFGQASCPIGSHEWIDQWGNRICRRIDTGQTTTIRGSTENCPMGTHPWVDSWGNKICKSFDGVKEFHDTSQGCPIGSHPWPDQWGNSSCRRF